MTALQALFGGQPRLEDPRGTAAAIANPAVPLTDTSLLEWIGGTPTRSSINVTETGSLTIPAVWRSVTLIAGVCAAMPLHAYRYDDEDRVPLTTGAEADLLADPHPDLTPLELLELVFGSLCLWGNAYLLILRDQMRQIRELWWINPARVKVGRADDGSKVYKIDDDLEESRGDSTILHIPGFGYDGVCGVSPIRLAREGLGLAVAAERAGATLFGQGMLATGILTSDQRLDDGQATKLKARWKAQGTGIDTMGDIRVLGSGAKYQQLTIPPEDAQFLETRQFQLGEIERMFGLPPHLLADTEKSTSWGTGIESQNLGLTQFTLTPYYLGRSEQRLTRLLKVISDPQAKRGRGTTYARYNVQGLMRGDAAARSAFYTALWQLGVLSTNDIRRLEDMGPVKGGDVRYVPLNMGVLGAAAAPADQTDPAASSPASGADDNLTADQRNARAAVEAVQKVYLGKGAVVTDAEARALIRAAGAGDLVAEGPLPEDPNAPDPAPAPVPPTQDTGPAPPADGNQEEVPAGG